MYARYPSRRPAQYVGSSQLAKRACPPCDCPSQSVGAQIGDFAQKTGTRLLKNWFGFGDYTVTSNSLVTGGGGANSSLQIVSEGNREVRVIGKEYVGDIFTNPSTAGAFYQQNFAINPGNVDVFPWLSTMASQYQQWKPNGIVFAFQSTSGDITSGQALGKIICATDYNTTTLSTTFENANEMLSESYSNESVPTRNILHGLECAPKERAREIYFVRTGGIPSGTSLAEYDLCQTTFATVGGPAANTNLGSLYVHYDITFYKNTLYNGISNKGLVMREWLLSGDVNPVTSPFGTIWTLVTSVGTNAAGISANTTDDSDFRLTSTKLTFPRWAFVGSQWSCEYWVQGASTASVTTPQFVENDSSLNGTNWAYSPTTTSTTTVAYVQTQFEVLLNTALVRPSLGMDTTRIPDTTVNVRLRVTNFPSWYSSV